MESNALRYFCITFCHLSWACLFIFNNKKSKSYIFGNCWRPFHIKSEIINPHAEGSASASALIAISLNMATGELSVNKWENNVTCVTYLKKYLRYFVVN